MQDEVGQWELVVTAEDDEHKVEVVFGQMPHEPTTDDVAVARDAVVTSFERFFEQNGSLSVRHRKMRLIPTNSKYRPIARLVQP